jgi:hypothetical protein
MVLVIFRKERSKLSDCVFSFSFGWLIINIIRYSNMDYIFLSALIGCAVLRLLITYDIACQWSRNLATRMEHYPDNMKIDLDRVEVQTAVPTFHIRAHGLFLPTGLFIGISVVCCAHSRGGSRDWLGAYEFSIGIHSGDVTGPSPRVIG